LWFGVCLFEVVVVQANFDVDCGWLTAGCERQGASFKIDKSMLVVGVQANSSCCLWCLTTVGEAIFDQVAACHPLVVSMKLKKYFFLKGESIWIL